MDSGVMFGTIMQIYLGTAMCIYSVQSSCMSRYVVVMPYQQGLLVSMALSPHTPGETRTTVPASERV